MSKLLAALNMPTCSFTRKAFKDRDLDIPRSFSDRIDRAMVKALRHFHDRETDSFEWSICRAGQWMHNCRLSEATYHLDV